MSLPGMSLIDRTDKAGSPRKVIGPSNRGINFDIGNGNYTLFVNIALVVIGTWDEV